MDLSVLQLLLFFFSSRRRHTRLTCDWSSDVCSSDLTIDHVLLDVSVMLLILTWPFVALSPLRAKLATSKPCTSEGEMTNVGVDVVEELNLSEPELTIAFVNACAGVIKYALKPLIRISPISKDKPNCFRWTCILR